MGGFCFHPRWNRRYWIYPPAWNNQKWTKHTKAIFKILDIRQWRTMISERQETNEVSPKIMPAYCPRVSRSPYRKGKQAESGGHPGLRRWSWDSGETTEQILKTRGLYTETSGKWPSVPTEYSVEQSSGYVCERTMYPRLLERTMQRNERDKCSVLTRSWGDWKCPFITMVTPVSVKCLCHRMGKFKHRNTSLCWIYRPGCNTKCHRSILQMSSENANRPESAFRRKGTTFTGCVVDNLLITILELYREAKWFGQKS